MFVLISRVVSNSEPFHTVIHVNLKNVCILRRFGRQERNFEVDFLGHFLLTDLLLPVGGHGKLCQDVGRDNEGSRRLEV